MGITWVIAFNFLILGEIYCNQNDPKILEENREKAKHSTYYGGKPKPLSNKIIPPPILSKSLSIKDISSLWRIDSAKSVATSKCTNDDDSTYKGKCMFKWLERQLNANDKLELNQYMSNNTIINNKDNDWDTEFDGGKIG